MIECMDFVRVISPPVCIYDGRSRGHGSHGMYGEVIVAADSAFPTTAIIVAGAEGIESAQA